MPVRRLSSSSSSPMTIPVESVALAAGGVSVASALVAVSPFASDIMSLTSLSGALYGACFLPALVVGMFLKRARAGGALTSSVCDLLAVVGWYTARMLGLVSLHEVYIGLLVGMGVYLLIALTGPKENQVPS